MSSDKNGLSRRDLVTHLGAGIAGATVAAAVPAIAQPLQGENTATPFVDPTTKYPKPPYDTTQQPWPGLASKMMPHPIMVKPATRVQAGWLAAKRSSRGVTPVWAERLRLPTHAKVPMLRSFTIRPKSLMRRKWLHS